MAAATSAVGTDAGGGGGGGGGARAAELGPATSDVPIAAVSADSAARRLSKRASRARRSASALSSASSSAETGGGETRPPAALVVVVRAVLADAEVEGPERSPHKSASTRRLRAISSAVSLGARTAAAAAAEVDAFAIVAPVARAREWPASEELPDSLPELEAEAFPPAPSPSSSASSPSVLGRKNQLIKQFRQLQRQSRSEGYV